MYKKDEFKKLDAKYNTHLYTGLLGFGLDEAAEVTIYPQYSEDGGLDSERTYIKQLVQKYVSDGSSEDLFNEDEIEESNMKGDS